MMLVAVTTPQMSFYLRYGRICTVEFQTLRSGVAEMIKAMRLPENEPVGKKLHELISSKQLAN